MHGSDVLVCRPDRTLTRHHRTRLAAGVDGRLSCRRQWTRTQAVLLSCERGHPTPEICQSAAIAGELIAVRACAQLSCKGGEGDQVPCR